MNAVVSINRGAPAKVGPPTTNPTKTLAGRLADIRRLYLDLYAECDRICAQPWARIPDRDARRYLEHDLARDIAGRRLPERAASARRWALDELAQIPTEDTVATLLSPYQEALDTAPSVNQTRMLIGLMIDAFPQRPPHAPEVYTETMIAQAMAAKHSPAVVAGACDQIVATKTFVPTTAEFLEACAAKAAQLKSATRLPKYVEERRGLLQQAIVNGDRYAAERLGLDDAYEVLAGGTVE